MTLQDFKDQVAREWWQKSPLYSERRPIGWPGISKYMTAAEKETAHDHAAELFAAQERKNGYDHGAASTYRWSGSSWE